MMLLSAAEPANDLTGFVGLAFDVISAIGAWGVALLVFAENLFPPIPSEAILPLAGFIASTGELNIVLVIVAATVGSWLGALVLYWLGRALGFDRAIGLLAKLPLVDREDFEKTRDWFHRHGNGAVFFGRLIPIFRSLISLPAGADRMPLLQFSLLTILGSGIWNGLLVGIGALLGTQYELVSQYVDLLNYVIYAVFALLIVFLVIRRIRRRRSGLRESE
jgi:membrane protein DedA with SNARE-associated domain